MKMPTVYFALLVHLFPFTRKRQGTSRHSSA